MILLNAIYLSINEIMIGITIFHVLKLFIDLYITYHNHSSNDDSDLNCYFEIVKEQFRLYPVQLSLILVNIVVPYFIGMLFIYRLHLKFISSCYRSNHRVYPSYPGYPGYPGSIDF